MPRPRPPHLHRQVTRHGRTVWYVRVGKGPRFRIRAAFGTPEFQEEYRAALAGQTAPAADKTGRVGSLSWLIEQYRSSSSWMDLSLATRRQRENIFINVCKTAGHESFTRIDRKTIVAGRDRRRETPAAAKHFVQAMRGLFDWAVEAEHVRENPTRDVKVKRPQTEGFHVWTDDECEKFEKRWPVGTRERLAFDLLLYTGFRRGDAVRVGRPHVKDGWITLRTEKNGTIVQIPILQPLLASIDGSATGELTFLATKTGKPFRKESFGNWFREACQKAGVPGSAHGLRKAGATRAANNGATEAELDAIFGWQGRRMSAVYTRTANRAKLAGGAIDKLMDEKENIYSLTGQKSEGIGAETKTKTKR